MQAIDLVSLVLLAAIWGSSYLFIRVASPEFGPLALMDGRVVLAGVVLLIVAVTVRRPPQFRGEWGRYLALGAVNGAAPFTLIAVAELQLTASLTSIIMATAPLWTALVAAVWGNEPLTAAKIAGLLLGLGGVAVLVGWSPVPVTATVLVAVVALLLAALAYAVGGTVVKKYFGGRTPLTLTIGQQLGAGAVLLPLALWSPPRHDPSSGAWFALVALAIVCTAVAYLLYFRLIARVGPTSTLSVGFLIPVFGVIWGALFLHEVIVAGTVVGLLMILTSVTLVTGMRMPGRAGMRVGMPRRS